MIVIIISLVISIRIGWVRAFNTVRGASCVKAGQSVYVLGGETYIDSWQPLKFIYKRSLNSLYFQNPADEGWIRQDIIGYDPIGLYTSAAAPPSNSLLHFYRVNDLDLKGISLKSIKPPNPKPIVINPVPQQPRTIKDSTNSSKSLAFNPSSLFVNDLVPTELILLIGKKEGELDSGSINLFDTKSLSWRSYPAAFLTESFHISFIHQGQVYVFGPGVNIDKLKNYDNKLKDENNNKLILARFDLVKQTWEGVESVGDLPEFNLNYSFTQQKNYVFLVGKNEGTSAIIYVLNLSSFVHQWIKLTQDSFIGYESGCLTYYDDNLYHYFGTNSSDRIQMISTAFWNLESKFFHVDMITTNSDQNKSNDPNLIPIIFGSLGGILALILFILLILLIRRRLLAPKFLQDHVICDPPLSPYSNNLTSTGSTNSLSNPHHLEFFEIDELNPKDCFNEKMAPAYQTSIKPK